MNNDRRKRLTALLEELSGLRSTLEQIQSEEQDAYDNMPEGLQQSEHGEKAEQACSYLDDAMTAFDEIESALYDAME